MKLFTERCFPAILLFSVLICLCASRSMNDEEVELKTVLEEIEAALEDIKSDAVEEKEPKENTKREFSKHLRPNMDLFEVNKIEEEQILHHKIHPEGDQHGYISQGDIIFKPGEERQMFMGMDDDKKDEPSNDTDVQNDALRNPYARWPTTIPYVISSGINPAVLQQAFDEYQRTTCLRFRPRTNERDYINFFRDQGCFSFIGRKGGAQEVSIGYGCECKTTVVHEIMHALGFFHEQARPDRDSYVRILYQNVQPDFRNNFAKVNPDQVTYWNTGYDYNSVMHYKNNEFSVNRNYRTIEALDNPNRVLGRVNCGDGLSPTDAYELNQMYCSAPQPPPTRAPVIATRAPVRTYPPRTYPPRTYRPRTYRPRSRRRSTRRYGRRRRPNYNYNVFRFFG